MNKDKIEANSFFITERNHNSYFEKAKKLHNNKMGMKKCKTGDKFKQVNRSSSVTQNRDESTSFSHSKGLKGKQSVHNRSAYGLNSNINNKANSIIDITKSKIADQRSISNDHKGKNNRSMMKIQENTLVSTEKSSKFFNKRKTEVSGVDSKDIDEVGQLPEL